MPAHRRRQQREPSPGPSWNTLSVATQQSSSTRTKATSDFSEAEIDELASSSQTPDSPRNSSKVTKNKIKPTAKIDFPTQKHTVRVSKLNIVSKDASSVPHKGASKRKSDINRIRRESISSVFKSHRTGQNRKTKEEQGVKGRKGSHGRKPMRPFRSISHSPSLPPPEDVFSQRDFRPKASTSIVSCRSEPLDMIELFSSDEEQPVTVSSSSRTKMSKGGKHANTSTPKSSTKPASTSRPVQSLGTIDITSSEEDTNPRPKEISAKIDLTMTSESDGEITVSKKRNYSRRKVATPVRKSASPSAASRGRTPLFLPDDDVLPEAGISLKALESSTAGYNSDNLKETEIDGLRGSSDRLSSNYGYGGAGQSPSLVEETASQSTPNSTPRCRDNNIYRRSTNIFRRSCALFGHRYTPSLSPRPSTVDPRLVSGSLEMEVDAFLASCAADFVKD